MAKEFLETAGKIADAIRSMGLATIAAALAVVSAGCLWLPDKRLASLKLLNFRNKHADWFGPVFWLSLTFFLLSGGFSLMRRFVGRQSLRGIRKYFTKRLENLTADERAILRDFYVNDTRTKQLRSEHPAVAALYEAGILFRPSQVVQAQLDLSKPGGLTYPMLFQVDETVWQILKKRPQLVGP